MQAKDKKELLERLTQNGLLYEVLNLSGREIIVHETTGHSSRKIGAMSAQIDGDADLSEDTKNALFTLYIPLMACSEGDLPEKYDDFFWMKDIDIEAWTVCAKKMNPRIFALLDAQEARLQLYLSEEQQAKKKRKRITSKAPS